MENDAMMIMMTTCTGLLPGTKTNKQTSKKKKQTKTNPTNNPTTTTKLVTYSNFWPSVLMYAQMSFMPKVMISLFSKPTSIPIALALSTSLLVRC